MCSNSMASAHCSCDFEVNQTKIKAGCQLGRKVVPYAFKSDLPLGFTASRGMQHRVCMFSCVSGVVGGWHFANAARSVLKVMAVIGLQM